MFVKSHYRYRPENRTMSMTRVQRNVLRRLRRAAWARLVVLCAAAFVALTPVAEAFCSVELPLGHASSSDAPPAHVHDAGSSGGDAPHGPCCDAAPVVLTAPDQKSDSFAKAPGRALGEFSALAISGRGLARRAPAATPNRLDVDPTSMPPFRRLKRLLI
jgi:hypothetical protein